MIVKEKTCILAYATTLTTDGPTRLVDLRNPVFPTPLDLTTIGTAHLHKRKQVALPRITILYWGLQ